MFPSGAPGSISARDHRLVKCTVYEILENDVAMLLGDIELLPEIIPSQLDVVDLVINGNRRAGMVVVGRKIILTGPHPAYIIYMVDESNMPTEEDEEDFT